MTSKYPGIFIVFEGLDGAGTTTQISLLQNRLTQDGFPVYTTKEPSNGPFGSTIRLAIEERLKIEPTALALAFAADRIDHLQNKSNGVVKALEDGKVVLCDRYVLSNMAYQKVFIDDFFWLALINKFALKPDMTFFIDTPVEECVKRFSSRSSNQELYHNPVTLKQVWKNYYQLFERFGENFGTIQTCIGTKPMEDLHKEILESTLNVFKSHHYTTFFDKK